MSLVDIREKEEKKKTILVWVWDRHQQITYSVIEVKVPNDEAVFSALRSLLEVVAGCLASTYEESRVARLAGGYIFTGIAS
jgi:hypothetical protein